MFIFSHEQGWYPRFGLMLWLGMLSLYAFTFPPFQFGIWMQAEPVQLAMFTLAALGALWLAFGVHRRLLRSIKPHPLWIALLLWAGWQCVVTAYAGLPWRGWFGPAENNDGAGLHMAALVMFLCALPVWQVARYRRAIIIFAAAGVLLLCALHGAHPESETAISPWRPFKYPDYLAFMAGALWITIMTTYRPSAHPGWLCGTILLMFIVLFSSHNLSGIMVISAAIACTVIHEALQRFPRAMRFMAPSRTWKVLAMLGCVLPLLIVPLADRIPLFNNSVDRGTIAGDVFDSESGIGSRIAHMQIGIAALRHEPERLWIGPGWGRFSEDMFKYALVHDAAPFINAERNPLIPWLVFGTAFHSHNQPLEALLSLGLLGMLLWYALPLAAIATLPRPIFWVAAPMIVALAALGHAWFMLAQNMPYQMLAWVALCSAAMPARRRHETPAKPLAALMLLGLAGVMAASAYGQYTVSRYGHALSRSLLRVPYTGVTQEFLMRDANFGGERLYLSGDFLAHYTLARARSGSMTDQDLGWFTLFLRATHAIAQSPQATPRLVALDIQLHNTLYFELGGSALLPLQEEQKRAFKETVLRLSELAPEREDFAAGFLQSLARFSDGSDDFETATLKQILAIAPNHRSALWLLGERYAAADDATVRAEGKEMQRRAATLGVARIYPLPESAIAELEMEK